MGSATAAKSRHLRCAHTSPHCSSRHQTLRALCTSSIYRRASQQRLSIINCCCPFLCRATVSLVPPPHRSWAIIFILFILDSTFAIAMYLQQKEVRWAWATAAQPFSRPFFLLSQQHSCWLPAAQIGKWKDYIYGEYTYIILSLSAKLLLAWIN